MSHFSQFEVIHFLTQILPKHKDTGYLVKRNFSYNFSRIFFKLCRCFCLAYDLVVAWIFHYNGNKLYFFPNKCAVVNCIGRISLLDMKSFLWKSNSSFRWLLAYYLLSLLRFLLSLLTLRTCRLPSLPTLS